MQVHWTDAEKAGRDKRAVSWTCDAPLLCRKGNKTSGEWRSLTPYASVTMVTSTSVHTPVENPHIEITYSLLPGPGAEETGHVHVSQSLENYGFPHISAASFKLIYTRSLKTEVLVQID